MRSIAEAVILSWGWGRVALAFGAGAASSLAQAPVHLAPVLFLTLPTLVLLLDGAVAPGRRGIRRLRPAAAVGWWFGFGYFLAGLWWIGAAFLVEAETFGWLMPVAVVALPAGLALFHALGATVARLLWIDSPWRVLSLAIGLSAAEWLRGHVLTGFPWNLIGQAAAFTDVTAQAASLVGVYGLTALGILVFAAPVLLLDETAPRARMGVLATAVALVVGVVGYGTYRLAGAPGPGEGLVDGVRFRIVQPAVDQSQKWDPEVRQRTLDTYLALSDQRTDPERLGAMSFSHILWPETALPFFLTEEPDALARIADMLPTGTTLVTGAPRMELGADRRRFYNSVYAVDDAGRIAGAYDKVHLVPFGEYLPLQSLAEAVGLRQLASTIGGFSAGPGLRTLPVGPSGLKAGILVCYEIIFSGRVTAPERPDVLFNLTNDAWFGYTFGPFQHLDMARLRAIEEGLPVVRAANTGISAVIDPFGRYLALLPLGERGVLDYGLPAAVGTPFFSDYGSHFLLTFYVISVILVALGGRKHAWKR
ncbi:apolipoprotein N-acyltransferase [Chthonobacter rhizosphaerae]|uniref:apolipoprotein N-acyltransferase n=1 Tax=Chthonobacter rhizosphaerae TaxID=2735553 RepID=UPI0015EF5D46|nr:apolipoprotein N-acyltransferase [Chthonobacter rhizosphaerae]